MRMRAEDYDELISDQVSQCEGLTAAALISRGGGDESGREGERKKERN